MAELSEAEERALDASGDVESEIDEGAEGSDALRAQLGREAEDAAAALATLKAGRDALAEPPKPAEPIPDQPNVVPPKVDPPAAPAADDAAAKVAARLSAMEARLRDAESRAKAAEAKVAEYEPAVTASRKGDIDALAKLGGWTPEMLLKLVDKGPEGVQPSIIERRLEEIAAANAELKNELARRDAENTVATYKASLSRNVPGLKEGAPVLIQYFTDPETGNVDAAAVADEIFAYQVRARNDANDPREVSAAEAAAALNRHLETERKRFLGNQQVPASGEQAPAKATPVATAPQQEPSVIRKPRVAPPPARTQRDRELQDEQEALATIRAAKKTLTAAAE